MLAPIGFRDLDSEIHSDGVSSSSQEPLRARHTQVAPRSKCGKVAVSNLSTRRVFNCGLVQRAHSEMPRRNTKRYPCNMCCKAFSSPSKLNRHSRMHSGDRPFVCKLCKGTFRQSHHLKDHYVSFHCSEPFRCEICSKTYSRKQTLYQHYLAVHPDFQFS